VEVVAHLDQHVEGLLNVGSIQGACVLWVRTQHLTCRGLLIEHACDDSHKMCIKTKAVLTEEEEEEDYKLQKVNIMLATFSDVGV